MRVIDLSPPLSAATPHWPGDQPVERKPHWSIAAGDSVNVATTTTSSHIGAHIDAPSHVRDGAPAIEGTPLDACIGPCLVVDVADLIDRSVEPHRPAPASEVIRRVQRLASGAKAERLLLRHRAEPTQRWDPHMPGLDPALVRWFGTQGARLIGIDLDSFDPASSAELPAHHEAIASGIVILEGLDLSAAPQGPAELFAPPIPWTGCDAAPVRAVLRVST